MPLVKALDPPGTRTPKTAQPQMLLQLHADGDDDVQAYATTIRPWLEADAGRLTLTAAPRAIADPVSTAPSGGRLSTSVLPRSCATRRHRCSCYKPESLQWEELRPAPLRSARLPMLTGLSAAIRCTVPDLRCR